MRAGEGTGGAGASRQLGGGHRAASEEGDEELGPFAADELCDGGEVLLGEHDGIVGPRRLKWSLTFTRGPSRPCQAR